MNDDDFNDNEYLGVDEDMFEWRTYEFKYKPGDIDKAPPFALFHLPRLDWRLWFLPLRKYNKYNDQWINKFINKLIKNEKNCPVIGLLKENPFKENEGEPIKAIRVLQYEYRFVGDEFDDKYGAKALGFKNEELLWENGKWWIRRYLQCKYIPIITQDDILNEDELKQQRLIQRIRNIIKQQKDEEQSKDEYKRLDNDVGTNKSNPDRMEGLLNQDTPKTTDTSMFNTK